jgi:hypothetical protein
VKTFAANKEKSKGSLIKRYYEFATSDTLSKVKLKNNMATGFIYLSYEQLEKLGYMSSFDTRNWFDKLLRKPVDKRYYWVK